MLKRLGGAPLPRGAWWRRRSRRSSPSRSSRSSCCSRSRSCFLGWQPGRRDCGRRLLARIALVLGTAAFAGLGLLLAGTLRAEATLALANAPVPRLPDARRHRPPARSPARTSSQPIAWPSCRRRRSPTCSESRSRAASSGGDLVRDPARGHPRGVGRRRLRPRRANVPLGLIRVAPPQDPRDKEEPRVVGTRGSREDANWLRGKDSNLRPSGYEPDELPLLHPAKTSNCSRKPQFRRKISLGRPLQLGTMLRRSSQSPRATTGVRRLLGATLAIVLGACSGVTAPASPSAVAPSETPRGRRHQPRPSA